MPSDKPPKKKKSEMSRVEKKLRGTMAFLVMGSRKSTKEKKEAKAKAKKKVNRLGPDRRRLEAAALQELTQMERRAQRKAKKRREKDG